MRTRVDPKDKSIRLPDAFLATAKGHCKLVEEQHNCEYLQDRALHLDGAEIGKSLFFQKLGRGRVKIEGMLDLRAKVAGTVQFKEATITATTGSLAVVMNRAEVGGSVFFIADTKITGQVDLRAKFTRNVEFCHATIMATAGSQAVDMAGAEVGGLVIFRDNTRIQGTISAFHAQFKSGLFVGYSNDLSPQLEVGEERNLFLEGNLDLEYAVVEGPVFLDRLHLLGHIHARHLHVAGDFRFCGSTVRSQHFANHYFAKRLHEKYQLEALPAVQTIGKQDEAADTKSKKPPWPSTWTREEIAGIAEGEANERALSAELANPAHAINLELAEIGGQCHIKGSRILGSIFLEDADIKGEANFDGSKVYGNLTLRSAKVHGRVFADEAAGSCYPEVAGRVDVQYAEIQQVDVKIALQRVPSRTEEKEDASKPRLSQVILRPTEIDLTGAVVDTICVQGTVEKGQDPRLRLGFTQFKDLDFKALHVLGLTKSSTEPTGRDFCRWIIWLFLVAFIGLFAWYRQSVALGVITGVYALLTMAKTVIDYCRRSVRLKLLDHFELVQPFHRGYYVSVERWLREQGRDDEADEVFLLRRRAENPLPPGDVASHLTNTWLRWLWMQFLDFSMGFGIRTNRLLHLFGLVFLLNIAVFLNPRSVERPIVFVQHRSDDPVGMWIEPEPKGRLNPWPSDGGLPQRPATMKELTELIKQAQAKGEVVSKSDVEGEWNFKHAFFISLRVQVPVLNLVTENDWTPATRNSERFPISYADYASIMMILNLILIPLIIASATGYVKKYQ